MMNKTLSIWGIVCLVLAGVLVILNLTLPPESLTFMIGNTNLPWVLPVVLGCVGICILLLATIGSGRQVTAEAKSHTVVQDIEKVALNKRLETVGWGLFLIMLGGFIFVPQDQIPKGAWSIGIGMIMLGLNAARYSYEIKMSGFTTFLGITSLLFGITEWIGRTSLQGAILLIILGAYLIVKPWTDKHQIFGKAEQSRV